MNIPSTPPINASILKVMVSTENDNKALERFWNLESIGILPENETEGDFVKSYQDSSIRLEAGQYCAKLPWKPDHAPLPTNEAIACGRTRSTVRRLASNPQMLTAYNDIINDQLK
jgi:hypothetical protein